MDLHDQDGQLAMMTALLRQETNRACQLVDTGEIALGDAVAAVEVALVALRARVQPAVDPLVAAEPGLRGCMAYRKSW